eukprot:XP_011679219.1 PREDICTED: uncharacterized protein LOC105445404 [Strongylocentrotus purpuratus]
MRGAAWKMGRLQSARQHDSHSCGAFVMLNALAVSKGIDPRKVGHLAQDMRNYVHNILIANAVAPLDERAVCDMLSCGKPGKDTDTKPLWVRCDVCGRWLHLLCVSLKKVSSKRDYVCPICEATYQ